MRTRTLRAGLLSLLACFALAPAAAAEVRLGSTNFWEGEYDEGFGEERPVKIFNGGVPSGAVRGIEWVGWGEPVARGVGYNPIYRPVGGYFPPARVPLKATSLGACPGEPGSAYRDLLVRIPLWPRGPLGPWFAWNGDKSLCGDGAPNLWVPPPGGYCGYTGEFEEPGQVKTIMASGIGCPTARRVAKHSRGEVSPSAYYGPRRNCGRSGCRVRIGGFRCRFYRLHRDDYIDSEGYADPALQRVACKRGRASILWWYARWS